MENEQQQPEVRIPQNGDSFVSVGIVDLAVSMFTLSVPFYDPAHPYLHQKVGDNRSVRFVFEKKSKLDGVPPVNKLVRQWGTAELYDTPLSPLSVCKRTIWNRRNMLRDAKEASFSGLQGLAKDGEVVVESLRLACIAYALGFGKPEKYLVPHQAGAAFIVNTTVPEWLKPHCGSWDELVRMDAAEMTFISAEGNDLHPVAVAMAAFINVAAWIKHLSTQKPYRRFKAGANKVLLVQEGSSKWDELIANGHSPE
jgi:hypothetical protein